MSALIHDNLWTLLVPHANEYLYLHKTSVTADYDTENWQHKQLPMTVQISACPILLQEAPEVQQVSAKKNTGIHLKCSHSATKESQWTKTVQFPEKAA